jgi:hypothetical protein
MRWQVFVQRRYRLHCVATRQRLRHGWLTWPSCLRLDACLPRQIIGEVWLPDRFTLLPIYLRLSLLRTSVRSTTRQPSSLG